MGEPGVFYWSFLVALVVTAFSLPLVLLLVGRRALDHPNERSSHSVPTPRIGGIGVLMGLVAGWSVLLEPPLEVAVAAAILLGLVGLLDDFNSLSAWPRLLAQLVVGSIVGAVISNGEHSWVLLGVTASSAVITAAYTNAFNFMDGVNGLSGLCVLVVGGTYLVAAVQLGQSFLAVGALLLLGTAAGFLLWNATGRVFLGDVGSYAYGGFIAALAVSGGVEGVEWPVLMGPLLIYFLDTGTTLLRRAGGGRSLMAAHRDHAYQRLCMNGVPHLGSAAIVAIASLGTAVGGFLIAGGHVATGVAAWLGISSVYLTLPSLLDRTGLLRDAGQQIDRLSP